MQVFKDMAPVCVYRCRRAMMAIHFDEVWNDDECNQMCDVCRHGNGKSLSSHAFLPT